MAIKHTALYFALSALLATTSVNAAEQFPATLAGHIIIPGDTKISVPDDARMILRVNGKFHEKHRIEELGAIEGKSNGRPTGINFPFEG